MGLHTGEVVVQAVESTLYQMFDAAGATVHIANRLEQMSNGGATLLSADTFNAAKQFVEARSARASASPRAYPPRSTSFSSRGFTRSRKRAVPEWPQTESVIWPKA